MGTHPIFESDFDCLTEWAGDGCDQTPLFSFVILPMTLIQMNYVGNSHATVPSRMFTFPVIITRTDHAVLPTSNLKMFETPKMLKKKWTDGKFAADTLMYNSPLVTENHQHRCVERTQKAIGDIEDRVHEAADLEVGHVDTADLAAVRATVAVHAIDLALVIEDAQDLQIAEDPATDLLADHANDAIDQDQTNAADRVHVSLVAAIHVTSLLLEPEKDRDLMNVR